MRFEHDGIVLWYGTPDAPAPNERVSAGDEITIAIGVQPADASNTVEVLYRINNGAVNHITANYLRNAPARKAQYFRAHLRGLRPGDVVDYIVICRCAGRQAPAPETTQQFPSSFRVEEVESSSASMRASVASPQTTSKSITGDRTVKSQPERILQKPTVPSIEPI